MSAPHTSDYQRFRDLHERQGAISAVQFSELAALGVKRVSVGGVLYRVALTALVQTAQALRAGHLSSVQGAIAARDIAERLPS